MHMLRIRKELCIYSWLDAVPDSAESKLNAPQESAEPNIALSGTALSGMDPGQAEHCPNSAELSWAETSWATIC